MIPLLLFVGCFIFSSQQNHPPTDSNCRVTLSESFNSESDSNDVTPSKGSHNQAAVWLIAADLGGSPAKNFSHKADKSSENLNHNLPIPGAGSVYAVNTLGQVNADLGRLFTLVGERPSGTS